jgi:hypothetical protein
MGRIRKMGKREKGKSGRGDKPSARLAAALSHFNRSPFIHLTISLFPCSLFILSIPVNFFLS